MNTTWFCSNFIQDASKLNGKTLPLCFDTPCIYYIYVSLEIFQIMCSTWRKDYIITRSKLVRAIIYSELYFEGACSNFCQIIVYVNCLSCGFPHFLRASTRIAPQTRARRPLSILLPIHYSVTILTFDTIQPEERNKQVHRNLCFKDVYLV
jgi:hypothetical protein